MAQRPVAVGVTQHITAPIMLRGDEELVTEPNLNAFVHLFRVAPARRDSSTAKPHDNQRQPEQHDEHRRLAPVQQPDHREGDHDPRRPAGQGPPGLRRSRSRPRDQLCEQIIEPHEPTPQVRLIRECCVDRCKIILALILKAVPRVEKEGHIGIASILDED